MSNLEIFLSIALFFITGIMIGNEYTERKLKNEKKQVPRKKKVIKKDHWYKKISTLHHYY